MREDNFFLIYLCGPILAVLQC